MDFAGKIVWVTGASSGIGEALCRALAKQGAKLILSARNLSKLESVKSSLANADEHHILDFDVSDIDIIQRKTEEAWSLFNGVDVLINNAGISQRSLALETSIEVDRKVMEVDYFAPVALSKAIVPKMLDNRSGCIINIASVAGKIGSSMRSAYAGAKHALIGYMDCLRAEVMSQGIRVINVCPGWVQTNISQNALTGDMQPYGELDDEIKSGIPVDDFVRILLKKLNSSKQEIIIARGLPKFGYQVRRIFPNIYHWILPKIYQRNQ